MSNVSYESTNYQTSFERHYTALLGMFRYLITQFADESVEVAARAVALAAPLPNAINMYNVAIGELGWSKPAGFAFSMTLEIVVFLLVEVALRQWDGYLSNPRRYRRTLGISIGVVAVAVVVVMTIVYTLETYKIMALLPVVSLCSFVGIGLKRWDERNQQIVHDVAVSAIVPEVQPQIDATDNTIDRRKTLAMHIETNGFRSLQSTADELGYTNKTVVRTDLLWLEKQGIVQVDRSGKSMNVQVNGHYQSFVNGER